jgi:folate-binding protein YgfZ
LETPAGPERLLASPPNGDGGSAHGWEVARIEAGMPRFGREFDSRSMPAEAGLVERAISFTKGCYPGQEPVARLHYRGHANRGLRGLRFDAGPPSGDTGVVVEGREAGRVTSTVVSPRFGPIGLGILRREVADGARVEAGGVGATVSRLPFA